MAKLTSIYVCQQCGYRSSTYLGKCPQCDSWNALVEEMERSHPTSSRLRGTRKSLGGKAEIVNLADIESKSFDRLSSKIDEFDRVLGGGIVRGSLVLIAGDPGIGKSTLLTQLAVNIGGEVLYAAGEESPQQIKIRVDRISPKGNLAVLSETDVDVIVEAITQEKHHLVIVDSIQALQTQDLESVPGSVGQVRECAHRLQRVAKDLHIPIFLVGHVTKEGVVAGPRTLEHLVDTVLSLEGDSASQFRILRSTKNRFGSTDEVGIFEMTDGGMIEVKNPSKLFLDQKIKAPGSAVAAILQGVRPLLLEIQALVTKSNLPVPRRTGSGVDNNRLQLLCAVLQKRMGLPLFNQDIFVNVTGGLRISETAADLGICLAIISSFKDQVVKEKSVFIGEVGLLGEIRGVRQLDKRISEAKKLGYTNVVTPENARSLKDAMVSLVL